MQDNQNEFIYEQRRRPPQSRKKKKKRRSRRELVLYSRLKAIFCMLLFALAVVVCVKVIQSIGAGSEIVSGTETTPVSEKNSKAEPADAKTNDEKKQNNTIVKEKDEESSDEAPEKKHKMEVIDGITYVDGIMIANKSYPLPESYDPGLLPEVEQAFYEMSAAAAEDGISLFISSGYRSHFTQEQLYNEYVWRDGKEAADTYSSRPGYSEHQTGYTIDVNNPSDDFRGTPEAKWIAEHCSDYGFIVRYPEGKEQYTGYEYEPWHIRYLGVETAKAVEASGLCLEEYLGIDSKYKD